MRPVSPLTLPAGDQAPSSGAASPEGTIVVWMPWGRDRRPQDVHDPGPPAPPMRQNMAVQGLLAS